MRWKSTSPTERSALPKHGADTAKPEVAAAALVPRFGGPHDRHIDLLAGYLQQGENSGT
jgi:hypothetical protein